jgi:hypothetical protein
LDLQDDDWKFMSVRDVEPVFLGPCACFWSTGLWHAFYGDVNTPIFVGHCVHPHPHEEVPRMKHPGKFAETDVWAAAVLSLHGATVVFQHPRPKNALPADFLEKLHRLPRFVASRAKRNESTLRDAGDTARRLHYPVHR